MSVLLEIWRHLTIAGPYVLFGFLAAGLIHTFISTAWIASLLGKRNWKSVFWASFFGIPLPLCSCSVIPTGATLRQKGAGRGAATSFLVSTPQTGVDSIALTYAMMDITMTILRPIIAFITALAAGIGVNWWGEKDEEESSQQEAAQECCCSSQPAPPPAKDSCCNETTIKKKQRWWHRTLQFAFGDLSNDLAHWLLLGFILSGIIGAMIPEGFFDGWAGQGIGSLFIMLFVSVPMYICASASTPIAAALIAKGLSPGAALVFLLAGPATNIGSIPILTKLLGRRSVVFYLLTIIIFSLLAGFLINIYYGLGNVSPKMAISEVEMEHGGILGIASALFLIVLLLKGIFLKPIPEEWKKTLFFFAKPFGYRTS